MRVAENSYDDKQPKFTIYEPNSILQQWIVNEMHPGIRAEVQRCSQEIRQICPEARIFVFGSSIDNAVEKPRDIDLLVSNADTERIKPVRRRILAIPRTSWPLDIIVVPSPFLDEKIRVGGDFHSFAVSEGIEVGSEHLSLSISEILQKTHQLTRARN